MTDKREEERENKKPAGRWRGLVCGGDDRNIRRGQRLKGHREPAAGILLPLLPALGFSEAF
jgi:hypothetical protein